MRSRSLLAALLAFLLALNAAIANDASSFGVSIVGVAAAARSVIKWLPYQKRWIKDKSRFKIALKARQLGYTWATCYEVVEDCVATPNQRWYYLSTNEARAKEAIADMERFARLLKIVVEHVVEEVVFEGETFKALVIRLPNGSAITGLPANARTARGVHGNLVLDEFAHHQDPRDIWTAVSPVVTRGFRIIVLSTPRGKGGKFYELWEHGGDLWSRHKTDIYEAVAQGLKVDIDELRRLINDPDAWAQEYECKFVDEAHAWIPYELIDAAEDRGASLVMTAGFVPVGPLWLGIDIGRTRGLTVFNLNEQIGDVHWTRQLQRLKGVPISDQIVAARPLACLARRTCIDKGVFGLAIFEALEKELGPSRVEGVALNAKVKEALAVDLKQAYEDKRLRNPVDPELRLAVHSVKRVTTVAGNVRFDAEVSDAGHADEFWAQALALMAASGAGEPFRYERVTTRPAASAFRRTRFDVSSFGGLDEDDDEEEIG